MFLCSLKCFHLVKIKIFCSYSEGSSCFPINEQMRKLEKKAMQKINIISVYLFIFGFVSDLITYRLDIVR